MIPKIYTKTGDQGQTGLIGGKRVSKADATVMLLGELDELNAALGLCRLYFPPLSEFATERQFVIDLQKQLFTVGTLVACSTPQLRHVGMGRVSDTLIKQMELHIDRMTDQLPPLQNFILPGGGLLAGHCHFARALCRRVERKMVEQEEIHPEQSVELAICFLNRLSDYLFVLARLSNLIQEVPETIWP